MSGGVLRTISLGTSSLGASFTSPAFELQPGGHLSVQATIACGAGTAPTGTWQLHTAGNDDAQFIRCQAAETGPMSLADLAPLGDGSSFSAIASFTHVPGTRARLVYVRADGGEDSTATLSVTVS